MEAIVVESICTLGCLRLSNFVSCKASKQCPARLLAARTCTALICLCHLSGFSFSKQLDSHTLHSFCFYGQLYNWTAFAPLESFSCPACGCKQSFVCVIWTAFTFLDSFVAAPAQLLFLWTALQLKSFCSLEQLYNWTAFVLLKSAGRLQVSRLASSQQAGFVCIMWPALDSWASFITITQLWTHLDSFANYPALALLDSFVCIMWPALDSWASFTITQLWTHLDSFANYPALALLDSFRIQIFMQMWRNK